MNGDLFNRIVTITEEYLGPTSHRFISRQIGAHLNKPPEDITPDDIPTLVEWVKLTLALVTEDKHIVEDYASKLTKLATNEAGRL
jgi:hypothetical protein